MPSGAIQQKSRSFSIVFSQKVSGGNINIGQKNNRIWANQKKVYSFKQNWLSSSASRTRDSWSFVFDFQEFYSAFTKSKVRLSLDIRVIMFVENKTLKIWVHCFLLFSRVYQKTCIELSSLLFSTNIITPKSKKEVAGGRSVLSLEKEILVTLLSRVARQCNLALPVV